MDHLLIPSQPRHATTLVPYLYTEPYDGQPWATYTVRHRIEDVQVPGSWRTRYGVLQNWLYFGPMTDFLGKERVAKGNFIRKSKEAKGLYINTSSLKDSVHEWAFCMHEALRNMSDIEQANVVKEIEKELELWLYGYKIIDCTGDELGQTILFSIAVLHESVCNAWANIRNTFSYQAIVLRGDLTVGGLDFPWRRMLIDGWCPRELQSLKSLPPSLQYYVSMMDHPSPDVRHPQCSPSQCVAYKTAHPKHVLNGCTCPVVEADTHAMAEILHSGSYPLIRMEPGVKDQPPTMKIVPYRPFTKFVAVSHVWSDGLGNPVSNSLSVCQLQRLTHLAEQVYSTKSMLSDGRDEMTTDLLDHMHRLNASMNNDDASVYLWVDTICCPMQSRHSREHALAINSMSRVYSEADKVIVLDNYIQAFPSTKKRLFRSPKMAKVSELERMEGALTKELFFLFADGLFEFESLMFAVRQQSILTAAILAAEVKHFHSSVRCIKVPEVFDNMIQTFEAVGTQGMIQLSQSIAQQQNSQSSGGPADILLQVQNMVANARQLAANDKKAVTPEMLYLNKFSRICDAAAMRSVTCPSDEAICLAILLDLDVAAVAAEPEIKRMEKFWSLQPHYSRSLACYRGPKLQDSDLEWAPASLINQTSGSTVTAAMTAFEDRPAIVHNGRIVVPFRGAIGETLTAPLPPNFIFRDPQKQTSWLITRKEGPENNNGVWPLSSVNLKIAIIVVDDRNPLTTGPVSINARLALVQSHLETVTMVVLGPNVEINEVVPGANLLDLMSVCEEGPAVQDGMTVIMEGSLLPEERLWCIQGHTVWQNGKPEFVLSPALLRLVAEAET